MHGTILIAEVNNGRVKKVRPREGVNSELSIGRLVAE